MKWKLIASLIFILILCSCGMGKPIGLQYNSLKEIPQPIVQLLPDGKNWKLTESYTVATKVGNVTAPKGFVSDLASVPRILWPICPPYGTYAGAAVIHDYLYRYMIFTRKIDDDIFYDISRASGTSTYKAWCMYESVRWFGASDWGK